MASEGADVVDVGELPTPGVAWLSVQQNVPAAVVSASHNMFADNGVKLFAAGGLKLPDATEDAIEGELDRVLENAGGGPGVPVGHGVGRLWAEHDLRRDYVDHLVGVLEGRDLAGMCVVVDCANGAASAVAPEVFRRLGAQVHAIGCAPDGTNINDGCGSTHPDVLAAHVVSTGAEIGLAVDGDADRLVAVDHTGAITTGDQLLSMFASDLAARGRLARNTVVVTVMSNLGLRVAMDKRGIAVHETAVGDRYVLEALDAKGFTLGGEQSGHLVFRELATTGDGVLTGVLLLDLLRRQGATLAELARISMVGMPQVLLNVSVPHPSEVVAAPSVQAAVVAVEAELQGRGRVLLRASGTEPVVRVMVEATDEDTAAAAAGRLRTAVEDAVASPGAPLAATPTPPAHRGGGPDLAAPAP
jgi:phosphoglucosamine mutase